MIFLPLWVFFATKLLLLMSQISLTFSTSIDDKGAVAQLGERLTGSQEVVGSIVF